MAAAVFFQLIFKVNAHEPVFGLAPETIDKNGLGIEYEYEVEKNKEAEKEIERHIEILYGLTYRSAVTVAVPVHSDGVGDVSLRYKLRVYQKDSLGAQNKIALIGGLRFPTGSTVKNYGDGSVDYKIALAAGHESTKWYYFADVENLSVPKKEKYVAI